MFGPQLCNEGRLDIFWIDHQKSGLYFTNTLYTRFYSISMKVSHRVFTKKFIRLSLYFVVWRNFWLDCFCWIKHLCCKSLVFLFGILEVLGLALDFPNVWWFFLCTAGDASRFLSWVSLSVRVYWGGLQF